MYIVQRTAAESQYIQLRNLSVSICIGPRFEPTTHQSFLHDNLIYIYRCIKRVEPNHVGIYYLLKTNKTNNNRTTIIL